MKRIGLTGGIGSGKSTVAALLRERGVIVIDADAIAREIVEPGSPVLGQLAEAFGPSIIQADGSLDRQGLASLAFATPEKTALLNSITHPAIEARTQELYAQAEAAGERLVVWDMPLLVDKGYHTQMDGVIVIDVDVEERVRRLVEYRGLDEADARRRIAAQVPDEQRRAAATWVIDNNGSVDALPAQVDTILQQLGW